VTAAATFALSPARLAEIAGFSASAAGACLIGIFGVKQLTARRARTGYWRWIAAGVALLFTGLWTGVRASGFRAFGLNHLEMQHRLAGLAALGPIDAHTHISQTGPAFVAMLARLHLHVLDILYVDDTSVARASLETERAAALNFVNSSGGRARLCTTFDPFRFNQASFSTEAIAELNRDFEQGAMAAKVWKNVGMELKDTAGHYILPDDPRLQPVYAAIAASHKTLIAHLADPGEAWQTPAVSYYALNRQWWMPAKPDAPPKQALLDARDHILASNPGLRVIGAHLGSMENDLGGLAERLLKYPNFAVDTSARVPQLARQPRETVRAFFLKLQDRILYGSDLRFDSATTAAAVAVTWENHYALDWRYFATRDAFQYMGQEVVGLGLPPSVLRKLFHDNAVRWLPGADGNPD
jgi:predicted TIM-barrel fold metal-dependent hydrolase